MPEPKSATVGASPGVVRSQQDGRRDPPPWLLAAVALLLLHPNEELQFKIEPEPRDKPLIEKAVAALQEEKRAFFHRVIARTRAIGRGLPDNPMPPPIGRVGCPKCGERFEFDRRGMVRAALAARGESPAYGTEPPVELRDALDVVVAGLAEELNTYAYEQVLRRLSAVYKINLKLSTDGFGQVIASAPDAVVAAEDEPTD